MLKGTENVALNALAKGYSPEQVCDLTKLNMKTITGLQTRL